MESQRTAPGGVFRDSFAGPGGPTEEIVSGCVLRLRLGAWGELPVGTPSERTVEKSAKESTE